MPKEDNSGSSLRIEIVSSLFTYKSLSLGFIFCVEYHRKRLLQLFVVKGLDSGIGDERYLNRFMFVKSQTVCAQ